MLNSKIAELMCCLGNLLTSLMIYHPGSEDFFLNALTGEDSTHITRESLIIGCGAYKYRVMASNADGDSAYSNIVKI